MTSAVREGKAKGKGVLLAPGIIAGALPDASYAILSPCFSLRDPLIAAPAAPLHATVPTRAGRDGGRPAQDRGTHMRGVGPPAPRRDNETKIQGRTPSRAPRGAQADRVKRRRGGPPSPSVPISPWPPVPSRCYAESMLMVAVARRLRDRPRESLPLPRPRPSALPGQPELGQRLQSRIRPRNLPLGSAAVLCNRPPRNTSSRPRYQTEERRRLRTCLAAARHAAPRGPLKNRDKTLGELPARPGHA